MDTWIAIGIIVFGIASMIYMAKKRKWHRYKRKTDKGNATIVTDLPDKEVEKDKPFGDFFGKNKPKE